MPKINLTEAAYQKLLEYAGDNDVSDELYTLLCWAEDQLILPSTGRPGKYYDSAKYRRTAAADRGGA